MIELSAKSAYPPADLLGVAAMGDASAGVGASATSAPADGAFRTQLLARLGQRSARAASAQDQARQAAEQFVSTALVMPLLKQMRASPFKSDYLHGGQGEDAFGPQLDQILADRIVERMSGPAKAGDDARAMPAGLGLVDAVYQRIIRQTTRSAGGVSQGVDKHG